MNDLEQIKKRFERYSDRPSPALDEEENTELIEIIHDFHSNAENDIKWLLSKLEG